MHVSIKVWLISCEGHFPINVSFPKYFPSPNISIIPQSLNNIDFIMETYHVQEDHLKHNLATNQNPESSTNANPSLEHGARVEKMHLIVTDVIQ